MSDPPRSLTVWSLTQFPPCRRGNCPVHTTRRRQNSEGSLFSFFFFLQRRIRLRVMRPLGKAVSVCVEQNPLHVTQQPRQKGKEACPMLSSSCCLADSQLVLDPVPKRSSSLARGKADGQNLPPQFAQRHLSSVLMAIRKDQGLAISWNLAEAALLEARVIGAWSSALS